MVIRSLYFDQTEILQGIMKLYNVSRFDCDLTYGHGNFWKALPKPRYRFDIDPQSIDVQPADSIAVPLPSLSLNSIVFDPPFLTYIRQARQGNGKMIMASQFGGYWTYGELEQHYRGTLKEAYRLLKSQGILVFKCQDLIHNHTMHCTHAKVIEWASVEKLNLADLFILAASHRLPAPNKTGTQKHARIFHSYFLVFQKP